MSKALLAFAVLFLAGCASPTALMQAKISQVNTAFAQAQVATQAVKGKEADLNRAAAIAYDQGDVKVGDEILGAQLTLTGPAVTQEDVLRQQVADLQNDKRELLANVSTLQSAQDAAQHTVATLKDQVEALALKDAAEATQEQQDNSWGGLYGLIRYAEKSAWTLLYVALGATVLILALRFASLGMPEIGLALTGVEHLCAAGFQIVTAVVGPGVLDAAGWIKQEWADALTSPSPKTSTPPTPNPTPA